MIWLLVASEGFKMSIKKRLELVLRNVAKPIDEFVITLEDLEQLLSSKPNPTAYIGYEPSGPIHVGYLPALEKILDLQKAGFHVTILLADLHAFLNRKGPLELIKEVSETYWPEIFAALGVDHAKYVLGSSYQLEKDYVLDLMILSERVRVKEAWKAMTLIAREAEDPTVSQYVYPLMQALDILYLEADLAFGGTDQRKVHVLAREQFSSSELKLNHEKWVPVAIHLPIILGLTGEKMSSSKPETHIAVHDRPETIRRKMRNALCQPDITDPEQNPIFSYLHYIIFPYVDKFIVRRPEKYGGDVTYKTLEELERDYLEGRLHPLDLKMAIAEYFIKRLESARKKLEADPDILRPVYNLQKWQWEHGLISRTAWEKLSTEYSYYGLR